MEKIIIFFAAMIIAGAFILACASTCLYNYRLRKAKEKENLILKSKLKIFKAFAESKTPLHFYPEKNFSIEDNNDSDLMFLFKEYSKKILTTLEEGKLLDFIKEVQKIISKEYQYMIFESITIAAEEDHLANLFGTAYADSLIAHDRYGSLLLFEILGKLSPRVRKEFYLFAQKRLLEKSKANLSDAVFEEEQRNIAKIIEGLDSKFKLGIEEFVAQV